MVLEVNEVQPFVVTLISVTTFRIQTGWSERNGFLGTAATCLAPMGKVRFTGWYLRLSTETAGKSPFLTVGRPFDSDRSRESLSSLYLL